MIFRVSNYKNKIESILNINNDLIKLKLKSPGDKSEIKSIKEKMTESVKLILDLRKDN